VYQRATAASVDAAIYNKRRIAYRDAMRGSTIKSAIKTTMPAGRGGQRAHAA